MRLLWGALIVIVVILLLPYLLVPLYRVVNPVSTLMFWRWAHGARVERTFVPIERIAPALPVTVIASEDGRFCRHHGSCDDSHGRGGIGEAVWDRVQSLPALGSGSAAENA